MITVQKFFWCCRLEIGGLVIGGLNFILSLLSFLWTAYNFIISCTVDCSSGSGYADADIYYYFCTSNRRISIGVSVMLMVLFGGIAYISFICIQGTKARNHKRVIPMLMLLFAALVISALPTFFVILEVLKHGVFVRNVEDFLIVIGIGLGIALGIAVHIYFFVVIYSLYILFRREHRTGGPNPNNYQVQYTGKV